MPLQRCKKKEILARTWAANMNVPTDYYAAKRYVNYTVDTSKIMVGREGGREGGREREREREREGGREGGKGGEGEGVSDGGKEGGRREGGA